MSFQLIETPTFTMAPDPEMPRGPGIRYILRRDGEDSSRLTEGEVVTLLFLGQAKPTNAFLDSLQRDSNVRRELEKWLGLARTRWLPFTPQVTTDGTELFLKNLLEGHWPGKENALETINLNSAIWWDICRVLVQSA